MSLRAARSIVLTALAFAACNTKPAPPPAAKQASQPPVPRAMPATAPALGAANGSGSGSGSASASAGSSDPCAHVADGVRHIWAMQVRDATDPATKDAATAMGAKAAARLEKHCRADGWSPEAIQCVSTGQAACTNKLTPAQQQALAADKLQ